jgi:hypothetical protein
MENFGYSMFAPRQKEGKKAPEPKEADWSKVYNFRMNMDSNPFKKKKPNEIENVWDARGFWK